MGEFTNDVKLAATKQTKTVVIENIDCNRCLFYSTVSCFTICAPIHLQQQLVAKATEKHKQDLLEAMDWAEELKMTIRKVKKKVKYNFLIKNSYLPYRRLRHAKAVVQKVEMC